MERSTCVSAAKLTIARGRCCASSAPTAAASPMSPRTKRCRASPAIGPRLRTFPAYVSLSRFSTGSRRWASQSRTKLEPMKPAPPVTRIIGNDRERAAASLASPDWMTLQSERAAWLLRHGVVVAIPRDEPGESFRKGRARCEAGGALQPFDRRVRRLDVAGLHRPVVAQRPPAEQLLEQCDERIEPDGVVVADVVDRIRCSIG